MVRLLVEWTGRWAGDKWLRSDLGCAATQGPQFGGRTAQAVAQKVISWKSGWAGGVPGWRHWGGGSCTAFRAQGGSSRVERGGGRKAGGGGAGDRRRGSRGEGERGRGGLVHDAVALE